MQLPAYLIIFFALAGVIFGLFKKFWPAFTCFVITGILGLASAWSYMIH